MKVYNELIKIISYESFTKLDKNIKGEILFNLLKNMKAYKTYSIDRGNDFNEYYMVSGEYGLQVQESGGFYNAVIKGAYKYLELSKDTIEFNELLKEL